MQIPTLTPHANTHPREYKIQDNDEDWGNNDQVHQLRSSTDQIQQRGNIGLVVLERTLVKCLQWDKGWEQKRSVIKKASRNGDTEENKAKMTIFEEKAVSIQGRGQSQKLLTYHTRDVTLVSFNLE